jgi:hypothetical protein
MEVCQGWSVRPCGFRGPGGRIVAEARSVFPYEASVRSKLLKFESRSMRRVGNGDATVATPTSPVAPVSPAWRRCRGHLR